MSLQHPHYLYRVAYTVGLAAAIIVTVGSGLVLLTYGQAPYGVSVGGIDVGGMSIGRVAHTLEERIEQYRSTPFRLVLHKRIVHATPDELGLSFDIPQTIAAIIAPNHRGTFFDRATQTAALIATPQAIPITASIDHAVLDSFLLQTFPNNEQPAQSAVIIKERDGFSVKPHRDGRIIDRSLMVPTLLDAAQQIETRTIVLDRVDDFPAINTDTAKAAQHNAETLLKKAPLTLTADLNDENSPTTPLTEDDIFDVLIFTPDEQNETITIDIDKALLREALIGSIAPALNRAPTNVYLGVDDDGAVHVERPSQHGIMISITEENVSRIARSILAGDSTVNLVATVTPAPLNEETLEDLGVTDFLGSGTTDYSGSPSSREHNIAVGAALYDGIILEPNEEFSFNQLLGDVGAEQGYLPELVIKNGKTIPEYGGGICQVSTTVFRAAMQSGLEITQRYPHSYAVRYYGTPGFDATIYPPNPDFRFRNDTPGHLLIQTSIRGSTLTFELFGTDDGRKTTIVGPIIYDQKEDGSMKAVVRQVVTNNGEEVRDEAFYSSYKSPALYPVVRNPLE